MKMALISDIHGNLLALEKVLNDIPMDVDQVWCLGDTVGYNPWPSECLQIVRDWCDVVIQGNHDRRASTNGKLYKLNPWAREALQWTRTQLTQKEREWLGQLPDSKRIKDGRVLLSHSDPRTFDGYIFPEETQNLDRFLRDNPVNDDLEVLVMGHTHIPHQETVEEVLVVNPGSVGQPRDGVPSSSYAILDFDTFGLEFRRVEYDIGSVVDQIGDEGLPEILGERLFTGK